MIDLRSFSNMWYWIGLAVLWSTASHWVMGVPFDMIGRARRVGGQAAQDLQDLIRIRVNRTIYVFETSGVFIVAFTAFLLSVLALLGFIHGVELAQAVFLMMMPMSLVALLNLSVARRIHASHPDIESLCHSLARLRYYTQMIGITSIFVTTLWGMYQNRVVGVF